MTKSEIKQIQKALRETVSPKITVDGVWGKQSEDGVAEFAKTSGVSVDDALHLLDQYAELRFVNDDAFETAAKAVGVPESYMRAVAEIESRGEGFLKDGSVKILFERHWFYKKLKAALALDPDLRAHVSNKLGIVVPVGSMAAETLMVVMSKKYENICNTETGGYKGNEVEWDRLNLAMDFDVESAAQATSYGGFQLMGFNCKLCGYLTAKEMMLALAGSESKQFLAVAAFIKNNPAMLDAMKKANWARFAELYNGSDYAKNQYDTKLAVAEKKWRDVDSGPTAVA
jgi:hypothetical protein